MQLYGRDAELAALSDLLDQARRGTSGTLVLRGDPGIGKTALVSHLIARADGFRVIRGAGIEEESELPFAGLQLLLRPALDRIDAVPDVQAEALRGALGLAKAGPPDRFLVGLAVLSLLAELAGEQPLLCVVDDAQWLDRASADALLFAARRLDSESIVLLLCARTGALTAAGLPELTLKGLSAQAAAELLRDDVPASRRYRVLAESAGNPLALLELPRALAGAQPEGPLPLTDRLRAAFEGQLTGLPDPARTVLLVAAAEGTGDLAPILRAAGALGASLADLEPARVAGLIEVNGSSLAFRHPLIRAAVHHSAPLAHRRAVHQALAVALDAPGQADRRAWQLAAAADGPDEELAAALERAAGQIRARGGDVGALAWYQRAAELSADPVAKARRLTLAAETAAGSGDLDQAAARAADSLAVSAAGATPEQDQLIAQALQVQATVAFLRGEPGAAHRRLLEASELIAAAAPEQANALLIEAVHAGWYVGQDELADAVTRLEGQRLPRTALERLLLRAVAPILGRPADRSDPNGALAEARSAAAGNVAELVLVSGLALLLGQDEAAQQIGDELSRDLRAAGQIGWLPTALFYSGSALSYGGRHQEALQTVAEGLRLAVDTGQQRWADALAEPLALLAAARGDEPAVRQLTAEALSRASRPAWNTPWTSAALGLLDLGLGRPEAAAAPLALFETWSGNTGQSWASALVHRCRALLDGDEDLFLAALALHEQDRRPFDVARTQLLYGEWLRRDKRKADARAQLRAALETLERIGALPWAVRARTELTATGATGRTAEPGPSTTLTPQESQIVRLAAQGMSNKDIAAQLFLSARTVGHHLYKAYPKLGVASRGELADLKLG